MDHWTEAEREQGYAMADEPFTPERFTTTPTGLGSAWGISDENAEGQYLAFGLTKEQAEFGVMLLREGALGDAASMDFDDLRDAVEEAILYTNCVACEMTFMQAQLEPGSKRCYECAS